MGSRYEATCQNCHHAFILTKGGGWLWYQKVCNTCGKDMKVPRQGPEGCEDGVTMTYLQLVKHLADGPSKWSRRGGTFDEIERKMLNEMTSVCTCGGAMISESSKDVIYRCPECKSDDLDLGDYTLFD
jgi:Zn finger protein HypA/HybF involved in hydrogenase expression